MLKTPDEGVAAWMDRQPRSSLWTTSVTVYELRSGIEIAPIGKQRRRLDAAFNELFDRLLERRVLPFDFAAAQSAGIIAAKQRAGGRPVEVRDVQIAGIVFAQKATLATRNIRHFQGVGLTLVDPWSA